MMSVQWISPLDVVTGRDTPGGGEMKVSTKLIDKRRARNKAARKARKKRKR